MQASEEKVRRIGLEAMGAWGKGTFDNDIALDWAGCLNDREDLTLIRETIAQVLSIGSGYLELELACEALAACEVVAWLRGNWGKRDGYTEGVEAWVRSIRSHRQQNSCIERCRLWIASHHRRRNC